MLEKIYLVRNICLFRRLNNPKRGPDILVSFTKHSWRAPPLYTPLDTPANVNVILKINNNNHAFLYWSNSIIRVDNFSRGIRICRPHKMIVSQTQKSFYRFVTTRITFYEQHGILENYYYSYHLQIRLVGYQWVRNNICSQKIKIKTDAKSQTSQCSIEYTMDSYKLWIVDSNKL